MLTRGRPRHHGEGPVLVAVSWGVRLSFWMWAVSGVHPDGTEETVGAWRREMWAQTAILREPGCATAVTWLSASLNLTLGSNLWYTLIIFQENIRERWEEGHLLFSSLFPCLQMKTLLSEGCRKCRPTFSERQNDFSFQDGCSKFVGQVKSGV